MKLTAKLTLIGIALIVIILGSIGESLIFKVPPGHVGVRTQRIAVFGTQGVVPEDSPPGWNRNFWFIDSWNLFDSTVQTFHMSKKSGNPFQLKSYDGYSVNLDVTIKYRIEKGKANTILVNLGAANRYQGFVENLARDACRSAFGVMKTEAFYQPKTRSKATKQAAENLAKSLKQNKVAVEIIEILIRDVRFDEQYERKIKDKKLADQDIELNKSKALAAEQKGRTNKIEAETKAMIKVIAQTRDATIMSMKAQMDQQIAKIRADYAKYVTETRADADLFAAEKDAAGLLLVKKAEAKGESLRNKALSGPGGAVLAALNAAKNIRLGEVTFSTLQLDPLDMEGIMKKLGVPDID